MTAFLLFLGIFGCGSEPECSEEVACALGSVCVEGACEVRYCSTSAQCEMEQYCSDGVCFEGCAENSDCYPGEACELETNSCGPAACTDTHEDCGYKEFCNTVTGECFDASGYYCAPCGGDADCGGSDNFCYGGWCVVDCETDAECPASYTCIPFVDLSGNILYYGCYTYCWLFEGDDYDLDVTAARPVDTLLELPECLLDESLEMP